MTGHRFQVDDRVRVRTDDRPGHHRIPGYCRDAVGRVVAVGAPQPLPDDVVAHRSPPRVQPVYAVCLDAAALFGTGDHVVLVDLWEDYLEEARR